MFRLALRAVLVLFGGVIAARLVEAFLTSQRGQHLAEQAGLADLTSHRGVELAQKYARAIVSVLIAAVVALQESVEGRTSSARQLGWPDRVEMSAQVLLAVGSIAKTVADFLEERRRALGESLSAG